MYAYIGNFAIVLNYYLLSNILKLTHFLKLEYVYLKRKYIVIISEKSVLPAKKQNVTIKLNRLRIKSHC